MGAAADVGVGVDAQRVHVTPGGREMPIFTNVNGQVEIRAADLELLKLRWDRCVEISGLLGERQPAVVIEQYLGDEHSLGLWLSLHPGPYTIGLKLDGQRIGMAARSVMVTDATLVEARLVEGPESGDSTIVRYLLVGERLSTDLFEARP